MNKALFLDRDGVINREKNYLYKISDFEFIDGVFETCLYFQSKNYKLIIITNQAGIAKGIYSEDDFHILNNWMLAKFKKKRIYINKVYYCPHHPKFSENCDCRKPNPYFVLKAKKNFNLDLSKSIFVGDKDSDIKTAINAGIGKKYLVSTGHEIVNVHNVKVIDCLKELMKLKL